MHLPPEAGKDQIIIKNIAGTNGRLAITEACEGNRNALWGEVDRE
jgi:hypothetical protein